MFSCNKSWGSDWFENAGPFQWAFLAITIGCAGIFMVPVLIGLAIWDAAADYRKKSGPKPFSVESHKSQGG